MASSFKTEILKGLERGEGSTAKLYALLDPSRNPGMLTVANALSPEAACLFIGDAREEFEDDAPWLVTCDDEGQLARHLVEEGIGNRWAVFVRSSEPFAVLFTHFRKFVRIVDGDGDQIFWRFFDPFVLSSQLPFLTREQRRFFFTGIEGLGTEIGEGCFAFSQLAEDGALQTHILEAHGESLEHSDNRIADVSEIPADLVPISVEGAGIRPMMRLTQSQIDGPLLYNRPALVAHIIENLDEDFEHAIADIDRQVLDQMMSHAISLAMFSYSIHDVEHIELFIDFMFRIAPGWHRQPALNKILSRPDLSTAQKFSSLTEDRMASAWDDAERYDDPREWLPDDVARQVNAQGDLLQ